METHFEGSRGENNTGGSHQRESDSFDESGNDAKLENYSNEQKSGILDSDVNTQQPTSKDGSSLTNDEDFDVNPNDVPNKPTFDNNK